MSGIVFVTQVFPLAAGQGSTTVKGKDNVESIVTAGSLYVAYKTIVLLTDAKPRKVV
jgi:hypothetical protein